jgi:hypothetical protein
VEVKFNYNLILMKTITKIVGERVEGKGGKADCNQSNHWQSLSNQWQSGQSEQSVQSEI